jgi:HD-GYP domain-containing protein (c-di-GMP phosphodiesterase class II)
MGGGIGDPLDQSVTQRLLVARLAQLALLLLLALVTGLGRAALLPALVVAGALTVSLWLCRRRSLGQGVWLTLGLVEVVALFVALRFAGIELAAEGRAPDPGLVIVAGLVVLLVWILAAAPLDGRYSILLLPAGWLVWRAGPGGLLAPAASLKEVIDAAAGVGLPFPLTDLVVIGCIAAASSAAEAFRTGLRARSHAWASLLSEQGCANGMAYLVSELTAGGEDTLAETDLENPAVIRATLYGLGRQTMAALRRASAARLVIVLLYDPEAQRNSAQESALLIYAGEEIWGAQMVFAQDSLRESERELGCGLPADVPAPADPEIALLVARGRVVGKLLVDGWGAGLPAEQRHAQRHDAVAVLAQLLALRIENRLLEEELHGSLFATIESLVTGLEARDPYTQGHSYRVTHYAAAIGEEMGLPADAIEELRLGGMLHDIGKIVLPEALLHKEEELTPDEWAQYIRYPLIGAKIIDSFNHSRNVLGIVLHHAEHYDGSGFPRGLRGEEIPLLARIVRVADTLEILTGPRPYGEPPWSLEDAAAEIERRAGTEFDPQVVKAFLRLVQRRGESLLLDREPAVAQ